MAEVKVTSDMSARVWKIEVAAGDRVQAGDTLLVLEAMKMETEITATVGGTVAAITVASGEAVSGGQVLVEWA